MMGWTKCGFCGTEPIQLEQAPQQIAGVETLVIRCASCKAAISTMDRITTNVIHEEIIKIKKALNIK